MTEEKYDEAVNNQKETEVQEKIPEVTVTEKNDSKQHASGPQVGPEIYYQPSTDEPFTQEEITDRQKNWRRFEETKENYRFNHFPAYFYAGFWIRFFAFLLDILCIQAITSSTIGLFYRLRGQTPDSGFLSVYALLSLAIYLVYFILLTKLNKGQTIGKMVFGIRVVSLDQEELSWATVLVREGACRFILKSFPFILGYLPAAFSRKKQHLGDYFSGTAVVTLNMIKAFNKEIHV